MKIDFAGKNIVFIDFETYYSTKDKYSLKELSVTEYVRDSRFKVHGASICTTDGMPAEWFSQKDLEDIFSRTDWTDVVVVSHNIKFDGAIMAWRYGIKPYAWFDTVALAKAILGENVSGYHLKGLADYLGLPAKGELKWDGVRELPPEEEAKMAVYCNNDVEICRGIYEKLMPQFPTSQLSALDWTIRCFLEPRLMLDMRTLENGVQTEVERREAAIKASGVDRSILSSNQQFARLLESRGITVRTKLSARTGKQIPAFAKTDEGLEELARSAPDLHAARIASKANLLETRGKSLMAVCQTGSFPFDVGFSGAVQTHRYSGGSGAGGNPQNFTRNSFLRAAVQAPGGYSLVVGDFAAVEARIVAWLAKEPLLMAAFTNDLDIYCDFAGTIYGRPINKHDDPDERRFGKEGILGLGYQMGAKKFQARVKTVLKKDISEDEAWRVVDLYRTTYFNVPKLWEFCERLIPLIATGGTKCVFFAPFLKIEKNAVVLPSGLRLQYPNLRWDANSGKRGEWLYDIYKKKYQAEPTNLYGGKLTENICQALAGEFTKLAIERAEAAGLPCAGQVHDEVIAISKDPAAKKILQTAMEQPPYWWPEIRLKAEVGFGPTWLGAKV